jgi:hypothetical protein
MEFTLKESEPLPEIEAFDDGAVVDAEVVSCKTKEAPFNDDDGNPVIQVEFIFELPGYTIPGQDGGTYTRKVYGNTSTTFTTSSKCKLRAWVTEIMGVDELPPGYRLELDNLVGNPCKVVLSKKTYQDKKSPMLADGTYPIKHSNRVTDVLRASSSVGVTTQQFDAPKFDDTYGGEEPF